MTLHTSDTPTPQSHKRPMQPAIWLTAIALILSLSSFAHTQEKKDLKDSKHFISSSLFMLYNFVPDEQPPSYAQLNYGYRITPKDTLIVEAITWQYHGPLGVPWGKMNTTPNTKYPGRARDFGVGLAYQRFFWEGAYATLHATPFVQQYYDQEDDLIQTGFQLFMTLRLGYHFRFWDDRFFFEPSIAATAWPINTNLPKAFAERDKQWPGYFLFEPGLHMGVNF